jgi:hypothetical protein
MLATDGNTTVVDHNDYNLTIYEAAEKLMHKEKIIAVEFPDHTQDELEDVYPDPVVLDWKDFQDMDYPQVFEELRSYDQFGIYL